LLSALANAASPEAETETEPNHHEKRWVKKKPRPFGAAKSMNDAGTVSGRVARMS
jgi:hypothetical protein